jgi:hypothetical protein
MQNSDSAFKFILTRISESGILLISSSDMEKTAYRKMRSIRHRPHSSSVENEDLKRCGE